MTIMMIIKLKKKEGERERERKRQRGEGGWGLGIAEHAVIKRHCVRNFCLQKAAVKRRECL